MSDLDVFLGDLAANAVARPAAAAVADAAHALDLEGDGEPSAAALHAVLSAVARGPGTLQAKLQMMFEIVSIEGIVRVPRTTINGG